MNRNIVRTEIELASLKQEFILDELDLEIIEKKIIPGETIAISRVNGKITFNKVH